MNQDTHNTDPQEDRQDIRRELAADHYQRTYGNMIAELCAAMRAEVAAQPGVLHLDMEHHCHLCGVTVGEEARSARNPNLFLCAECRGRLRKI